MDRTLNYINTIWTHSGFQKYFKNTGWMLTARIISLATSFFTIAIVARYLGPENLGKLEYAQSFVAIISIFASLGIDQILYRDLIEKPEEESKLIGTAVFSKLFFGFFALILSAILSIWINSDPILTAMIAIMAFTFIINPINTISILFNSQVKAKYGSQITIFLALLIPGIKILVIYLDKGILYFSSIILLEAIVSAIWSTFIYIKEFNGNIFKWEFDNTIFKKIIKDSWPLLLAGLSGYIYSKMDQIMLLHYLDSATVGIYSAAVKLTQIWIFLPSLIIGSLFPAIINAKKTNYLSYKKRFQNLSAITVGITLIIATPLFIFSSPIIKITFGEDFMGSVSILNIYLWVSVAITLVTLSQQYLIAENLSKVFLYSSIIGATLNIILNIILIPDFGGEGAAVSTLLSYIITALSILLFKNSRDGILKIFKRQKKEK